MADSRQVAGLVGPTVMVLCVSEALNFRIWDTNLPPVTYLNGIILFVAGLALIRAHNRWLMNWSVLVTLSGYLALLLGLFRVFAPGAQQAPPSTATYLGLGALFLAGVTMTYKAYFGRGA